MIISAKSYALASVRLDGIMPKKALVYAGFVVPAPFLDTAYEVPFHHNPHGDPAVELVFGPLVT